MIRDNFRIIRDYFKLVKGSKKWIFLLFFGSITAHIASLLKTVFASNIIFELTNGDIFKTYLNIGLLAVSYIAYNLMWYVNYIAYSHNFQYCYQNLREKIIDKVFTYDTDFSNKLSKGKILNTVNSDISNLAEMVDNICEIIVVFVKLIFLIIIFIRTNIYIGILVLVLEFLNIKAYNYCNVMSTKYLRGQQKYRDKLTDNLSQILNGLGEIKVFNIFDKIKTNFYIISNKWSHEYMLKRKYYNIKSALLPFISHMGKIMLYSILAYFVLIGKFEINVLIILINYFTDIMSNTKEVMNYSRQIREWSISIDRINEVLNYSSKDQIALGDYDKDDIIGLVEFKHVSFKYKAKNRGFIDNISFTAEPNQITALVGHSGSGKTTITNLLLRKYKADSGLITIDGENIYSYSKDIYSTNIVGVNQSPFIFNMSIRKNLSLVDSNITNQIEACKRVGIHDYIESLPRGYNTVLSENATNFSGGQRQLLAIARTLLSKSEILIFDEVTSSLDPALVERIKEIFENLKVDHTIIIVTHKKDVMKIADKIVVLKQGRIVGEGTHRELMKNNAVYQDIQKSNYSSSHKQTEEN